MHVYEVISTTSGRTTTASVANRWRLPRQRRLPIGPQVCGGERIANKGSLSLGANPIQPRVLKARMRDWFSRSRLLDRCPILSD